MAEGSNRVVYAALAGNVLVAVSKFLAAGLSRSSAMLTESIHSTADCANQLLLLYGVHRGRKPADASHNFGYGAEIYFWTFVVAVLVLFAGGAASIAEGVRALSDPEPSRSLPISLAVLGASILFEGGSLIVSLRESENVKRWHPGRRVGYWKFIQQSKNPALYETILEDSAALAGIAIALFGVIGNGVFDWLWADGLASCAIGVLLIADALIILAATRGLIAGEAVVPTFLRDIRGAIANAKPVVRDVRTLHLGPDHVLVFLTLKEGSAAAADPNMAELVQTVRRVDDRIVDVVLTT